MATTHPVTEQVRRRIGPNFSEVVHERLEASNTDQGSAPLDCGAFPLLSIQARMSKPDGSTAVASWGSLALGVECTLFGDDLLWNLMAGGGECVRVQGSTPAAIDASTLVAFTAAGIILNLPCPGGRVRVRPTTGGSDSTYYDVCVRAYHPLMPPIPADLIPAAVGLMRK